MTNVIWIFILIFPLMGFWSYGLFDLDEGFYAAVTAEMIKNQDFIVPTYQGVPWFEKPILLYWATSFSIYLIKMFFSSSFYIFLLPFVVYYVKQKFNKNHFNINSLINSIVPFLVYLFCINQISPLLKFIQLSEFALRLPSFLAIIALYGSIYYWIKKWVSVDKALFATLICSTSIFTVAIGKLMLTDALYVSLFTHAVLSYYDGIYYNPKSKIWTGFFIGLAMLAKGPVAPFLFGLIALISHFLVPHYNKRKYLLPSLIAFFLVISLWYIPVYLKMPETFWTEFIINQNVQRFLGGDKAHKINNIFVSLIYYVPIIFIGLFPWSLKLKKIFCSSFPLSTYLKIWILTVFVFFTFSQSKLPHYIFPCIPPLAILLSLQVPTIDFNSKKILFRRCFHALSIFVITQSLFISWYFKFHPEEMITKQIILDSNLLKNVSKHCYWYDLNNLSKGFLGISPTSHPSASFYKIFGHNLLQHKNLYNEPIIEIKTFDSLKLPCTIITRGKPTPELLNYLKTKQVKTYSYPYPATNNVYITLYTLN